MPNVFHWHITSQGEWVDTKEFDNLWIFIWCISDPKHIHGELILLLVSSMLILDLYISSNYIQGCLQEMGHTIYPVHMELV
jgi:hypothetical protein